MKLISLVAALSLSLGAAEAQNFKRITTEADYIAKVAGKKYCNEGGCWTAKKNGRMTGKFGKDRFKANWAWKKSFACRTGTLGKRDIGTDCQVIEVAGNKVRITRKQGKGKKVVYSTK